MQNSLFHLPELKPQSSPNKNILYYKYIKPCSLKKKQTKIKVKEALKNEFLFTYVPQSQAAREIIYRYQNLAVMDEPSVKQQSPFKHPLLSSTREVQLHSIDEAPQNASTYFSDFAEIQKSIK
ncbi:Hypothetical_protein [Hexamita inflata]|uniref:Hypothetical_protein n=1 Tax=Hexamita inflata TaxID=28002 RepID=A0AA86V028_9EUKA|nr:Hypothetical protein HINF_LOCUS62879 [Hexamita inflata]CAI9975238.1 Hypothetical protein HINF_LOCUS62883 [Hexamita inflata]